MNDYRMKAYDIVNDIYILEKRFLGIFWKSMGAGSKNEIAQKIQDLKNEETYAEMMKHPETVDIGVEIVPDTKPEPVTLGDVICPAQEDKIALIREKLKLIKEGCSTEDIFNVLKEITTIVA